MSMRPLANTRVENPRLMENTIEREREKVRGQIFKPVAGYPRYFYWETNPNP
jgi:hypothetical protein